MIVSGKHNPTLIVGGKDITASREHNQTLIGCGKETTVSNGGLKNSYPGGKGNSYQKIINQIRPAKQFIVPFLGNCAVLRNIKKFEWTLGLDKDATILNNYWSQKDIKFGQFVQECGIEHLEDGKYINSIVQTVIYCDPPYPLSTRSKKNIYRYEMSDADHERLLKAILKQECDVLISTYKNDMYSQYLNGWRKIEFEAMTRGGVRTEVLYMNYPEPEELHDYSFLGNNFRERGRISKKINRWCDGIMRLPILERKAILEKLNEVENV